MSDVRIMAQKSDDENWISNFYKQLFQSFLSKKIPDIRVIHDILSQVAVDGSTCSSQSSEKHCCLMLLVVFSMEMFSFFFRFRSFGKI